MTTTILDQATATMNSPASVADHSGAHTALVTGISSGIGEDTAHKLQALGYIVYGAARRTDRFQALTADGIHPLSMDAADDASMSAGANCTLEETGHIDVLVNSVGYGSYGVAEDAPIDEAHHQFEANVFSLGRFTQPVTPHMRTQGSGTIINISSMDRKLVTPLDGQYHATKYAVEALSDTLCMELRPFGVDVVVVEPGGIRTEWASIVANHLETTVEGNVYVDQIRAVAGAIHSESNSRRYSPLDIITCTVGKIVTARHPRTRCVVGFMAKSLIVARRVLPNRVLDQPIGAVLGFCH